MGKIHLNNRKFSQAKDLFIQALKLDPSNYHVQYSLGKVFSEMQEYKNAISVLEQVLASVPNSHLCISLLAKAYRETGNLERATELERKAAEESSRENFYHLIVSARQQIQQKNFNMAESYYNEAVASVSGRYNVELLVEVGSFLRQRKKCRQAETHLTSALELLDGRGERESEMSDRERAIRENVLTELQQCSGSVSVGRETKKSNDTDKHSMKQVKNIEMVDRNQQSTEEQSTGQEHYYHH